MPKGKSVLKEPVYFKAMCKGCKEEFTSRRDVPEECPFCSCTNIKELKECV